MEMNGTTRSLTFLLLLLLFSPLSLFTSDASAIVGGWKPIKDPNNDSEVQTVAKFAVAEHNKAAVASSAGGRKGHVLVFLKVVSGETQVVAGTNYRLVIKVKDRGLTGGSDVCTYEVVVYVKPWERKAMELTSFKLLG